MVPAVLRFIDTRGGSHKGHYVNGPARELHRQRAKGARAVADQINLRCKSKSLFTIFLGLAP